MASTDAGDHSLMQSKMRPRVRFFVPMQSAAGCGVDPRRNAARAYTRDEQQQKYTE